MNFKDQLKIQAWIDNELDEKESLAVKAMVESNSDAKKFAESLRKFNSLLTKNEPEYKLPISQSELWANIKKEINHPQPRVLQFYYSSLHWLESKLIPVAIAASLVIIGGAYLALKFTHNKSTVHLASEESAALNLGINVLSFYAPKQEMYVVWVDTNAY